MCRSSHTFKQCVWKRCLQGMLYTVSSFLISHKQMEHSDSCSVCTVGGYERSRCEVLGSGGNSKPSGVSKETISSKSRKDLAIRRSNNMDINSSITVLSLSRCISMCTVCRRSSSRYTEIPTTSYGSKL